MKITLLQQLAGLSAVESDLRRDGRPLASVIAAARRTLEGVYYQEIAERERLKEAARLAKVRSRVQPAGIE